MKDSLNPKSKHRHLIFRHWSGDARLWQAYWLIAVGGGWVFWTVVLNLVKFAILPEILAVVILVVYSIYAAVGVWRCAFNADWRGWAYISRVILVISGLGIVFELSQNI